MSELLVIEFPGEGVREVLLAMREEYLIEPDDAVVAIMDESGRIKLEASKNGVFLTAGSGTFPGFG